MRKRIKTPTPFHRPIRTPEEYQSALDRLNELMISDPENGSDEDDELEMLELLIGKWDQENAKEWPLTPIEAIQFRMQQGGLTKVDLEPYLGSKSRVSEVLSGSRELSLTMLRKLHEGLGIPAKSLIGSKRIADGEEFTQDECEKFPLKEMQDRNCFVGVRGLSNAALRSRAKELMTPWIRSISTASPALLRSPLYQSGNRTMDDHALLAWRLIVLNKAQSMKTRGEYKDGCINAAWLRGIAKLSAFDDGPKLANEQLSRHGIRLVIVKHFAKTYLDGAAMMDKKGPIVALTLRHDRIDNFFFALIHELEHVGRHLGDERMFIADNLDDKGRRNQIEEEEADKAAQEALIPSSLWESSAVKCTYSLEDALDLARKAEVHPAIVAGRVRFVTGNWRLLSGLISAAGTVSQHFGDQLN